jgi:hypothetical protein
VYRIAAVYEDAESRAALRAAGSRERARIAVEFIQAKLPHLTRARREARAGTEATREAAREEEFQLRLGVLEEIIFELPPEMKKTPAESPRAMTAMMRRGLIRASVAIRSSVPKGNSAGGVTRVGGFSTNRNATC